MGKNVAIGLSGGVDSSVSAALLIEQGYEVTGVYITCWSGVGCRSEEDRKDALDISLQLGIPFVHLDFQKEYKDKVYEYMIAEYQAGRTPNPDVVCNKEIKFGLFYEWGMEHGFDFVATGHYAQVGCCNQHPCFCSARLPHAGSGCALKNQECCLLRSKDDKKDQTYFLYLLRQEQLEHILFPIGHMLKSEVRAEALKRGLLTAKKPDSVGICFIGEQPMDVFLAERIMPKKGEIKMTTVSSTNFGSVVPRLSQAEPDQAPDTAQNSFPAIVGEHKGVQFYTIGQKIAVDHNKMEGFDKTNLPYFYVVDKDVEKNILYVGTADQLDKSELTIGDLHWIGEEPKGDNLCVRIRHMGELILVSSLGTKDQSLITKLAKPVRGVAPGQSVVFYQDEICLGGGIIA